MAATCGAAADVPKKLRKFGREVDTPSAAAMSGFWYTSPPVEEESPGVRGVRSGWKKTRRGPSELKDSTGLTEPPTKGVAGERTQVAATLKAFDATAALCPITVPPVWISSTPRPAPRCRKRGAPEHFTIT